MVFGCSLRRCRIILFILLFLWLCYRSLVSLESWVEWMCVWVRRDVRSDDGWCCRRRVGCWMNFARKQIKINNFISAFRFRVACAFALVLSLSTSRRRFARSLCCCCLPVSLSVDDDAISVIVLVSSTATNPKREKCVHNYATLRVSGRERQKGRARPDWASERETWVYVLYNKFCLHLIQNVDFSLVAHTHPQTDNTWDAIWVCVCARSVLLMQRFFFFAPGSLSLPLVRPHTMGPLLIHAFSQCSIRFRHSCSLALQS